MNLCIEKWTEISLDIQKSCSIMSLLLVLDIQSLDYPCKLYLNFVRIRALLADHGLSVSECCFGVLLLINFDIGLI